MRVLDLERRAAERFDEVHDAAVHQLKADRIDDQPDPIGLRHNIVSLGRVGEAKLARYGAEVLAVVAGDDPPGRATGEEEQS